MSQELYAIWILLGLKETEDHIISSIDFTRWNKLKDIASTASTGKTISAERYNLPDHLVRYIRVTVHGNSENHLASIKEMGVRTAMVSRTRIYGGFHLTQQYQQVGMMVMCLKYY